MRFTLEAQATRRERLEMILLDRKQGVWVGYLGLDPPNSLSTFAATAPSLVGAFPWALITRQDGGRSERLSGGLTSSLKEHLPDLTYAITSDYSVLLSGADFVRAVTFQDGLLFSDFSEVWFFDQRPTLAPSLEVRLTSEQPFSHGAIRPWEADVVAYMANSGCLLGLGDGAGINFATPSRQRAAAIIAACETERARWEDEVPSA